MTGGIEFLDEPEPPANGPPNRHHDPQGPGRRGIVIALVLAAVVLAGLLIGRAVTSGGSAQPAASPHATATRASASPTAVEPTVVVADPVANCSQITSIRILPGRGSRQVTVHVGGKDTSGPIHCSAQAAQCPEAGDGQNACATSPTVPPAVLQAVHQRFPSARVVEVRNETIRENGRLWFRYVRFQLPRNVELGVEVAQGHPDAEPQGRWTSGADEFSRVAVDHGNFHTLITSDSQAGADLPNRATLRALAEDPSLTVV